MVIQVNILLISQGIFWLKDIADFFIYRTLKALTNESSRNYVVVREKKKFYVTIKHLLRVKYKIVFFIIKNEVINKKFW